MKRCPLRFLFSLLALVLSLFVSVPFAMAGDDAGPAHQSFESFAEIPVTATQLENYDIVPQWYDYWVTTRGSRSVGQAEEIVRCLAGVFCCYTSKCNGFPSESPYCDSAFRCGRGSFPCEGTGLCLQSCLVPGAICHTLPLALCDIPYCPLQTCGAVMSGAVEPCGHLVVACKEYGCDKCKGRKPQLVTDNSYGLLYKGLLLKNILILKNLHVEAKGRTAVVHNDLIHADTAMFLQDMDAHHMELLRGELIRKSGGRLDALSLLSRFMSKDAKVHLDDPLPEEEVQLSWVLQHIHEDQRAPSPASSDED